MTLGKLIAGVLILSVLLCSTAISQATRGNVSLTVKKAGDGAGIVVSSPPGIDCGEGSSECTATFNVGASVTLTPRDRSLLRQAYAFHYVDRKVVCTKAPLYG